jgi:hypothetical protein
MSHEKAFYDIAAEHAAQVAKGRDAAKDDARVVSDWANCLMRIVMNKHETTYGWRAMWVKIGALAVSAIESHDRKTESHRKVTS